MRRPKQFSRHAESSVPPRGNRNLIADVHERFAFRHPITFFVFVFAIFFSRNEIIKYNSLQDKMWKDKKNIMFLHNFCYVKRRLQDADSL